MLYTGTSHDSPSLSISHFILSPLLPLVTAIPETSTKSFISYSAYVSTYSFLYTGILIKFSYSFIASSSEPLVTSAHRYTILPTAIFIRLLPSSKPVDLYDTKSASKPHAVLRASLVLLPTTAILIPSGNPLLTPKASTLSPFNAPSQSGSPAQTISPIL